MQDHPLSSGVFSIFKIICTISSFFLNSINSDVGDFQLSQFLLFNFFKLYVKGKVTAEPFTKTNSVAFNMLQLCMENNDKCTGC